MHLRDCKREAYKKNKKVPKETLFNLANLYVVQHDLGMDIQDRPIRQPIHLLNTTQRYISFSTLDNATIIRRSIRETLDTH